MKSGSSAGPTVGGSPPKDQPGLIPSENGDPTASLYSHGEARVTLNPKAVHVQTFKELTTYKSSTNIRGHYLDSSSKRTDDKNPDKSPSTVHSQPKSQQYSHNEHISYVPLTTQMLHEHNSQQEYMSGLPGFRYISLYEPVNMPRDPVFQFGDTKHIPASKCTAGSNDCLPGGNTQAQSLLHNNPTAYGDVDWNIPDYQSTLNRQFPEAYQKIDPGQKLTDWAIDLSGIGKQFTDYTCDEDFTLDELVAD